MTLRRVFAPLVLGAMAATAALTAHADDPAQGDPEAGRYIAQTCLGCHGIPGYTNVYPTYHVPKLGGQHEEYLIIALEAYREGRRESPVMKAQAASLSDREIRDIAAFFSNIEPRR